MKCPFCGFQEHKVLDSRPAREGAAIRRRRECLQCERRFTTFEEPERPRLLVIKRDGVRAEYDRDKLLNSMVLACGKRPVSINSLQDAVDRIEQSVYDQFDQEVETSQLGDRVMDELYRLDGIAYIRYASVYQSFEHPQEFADLVRKLQKDRRKSKPKSVEMSKD